MGISGFNQATFLRGFDDFLMERDVFEDFTPSEVDAIHAALRREEAAKQSAEMDNRLAEDHGGRHGNDRNEW